MDKPRYFDLARQVRERRESTQRQDQARAVLTRIQALAPDLAAEVLHLGYVKIWGHLTDAAALAAEEERQL